MGFPVGKLVLRSTLIGVMLGGGLLSAGISQAQGMGAQDITLQTERDAELAAAAGGPASSQHLIPFAADRAAVEMRDAEVAGSTPESASTPEAAPLPTASPATPAVAKVAAAEMTPAR